MNVTPCSVVTYYQHFGRNCCRHLQGDGGTLLPIYQTIWRQVPEDSIRNAEIFEVIIIRLILLTAYNTAYHNKNCYLRL